jgi:hypothetical protein
LLMRAAIAPQRSASFCAVRRERAIEASEEAKLIGGRVIDEAREYPRAMAAISIRLIFIAPTASSARRWRRSGHRPRLGEHTAEILREIGEG